MSSMFKISLKKKKTQTYAQNVGANWFYALQNKVQIKEMNFMAVAIFQSVDTLNKSSNKTCHTNKKPAHGFYISEFNR